MDNIFRNIFSNLAERFVNYLPDLFAGFLLIAFGLLVGWFVKRLVIQVSMIIRVDRVFLRFRWGESLSKADVRHAMFNLLGNIAFLLVFLMFLDFALSALKLTMLSNILQQAVFFFPKLIISIIILGIGWFISSWLSVTLQKSLLKEKMPRATMIARFIKGTLLLFFCAIALVELDVAREIIVIGFAVSFATIGALTIVITALGGKNLVGKILDPEEEEKQKEEDRE